RAHPRVAKIIEQGGYRASRTAMDLSVSKALVRLLQEATHGQTVVAPTLADSVPMYVIEDRALPWIGVPTVNYDNHQHAPHDNLGIGNLWDGIELSAVVLADLDW